MNHKDNERKQRNPNARKDVIMPVPVSENQMPDSYSLFFWESQKTYSTGTSQGCIICKCSPGDDVLGYWKLYSSKTAV